MPFRDTIKYNRKINTIIGYTCLNVAPSLRVIATYGGIYFITVGAFRKSTKVNFDSLEFFSLPLLYIWGRKSLTDFSASYSFFENSSSIIFKMKYISAAILIFFIIRRKNIMKTNELNMLVLINRTKLNEFSFCETDIADFQHTWKNHKFLLSTLSRWVK